ncbi:MAG: YgiQ family radical SAM protein, partial [Alphaproteobacteria bacterium]
MNSYAEDRRPVRHPPMSKRELEWRGWDQLDVILVSGDAFIDHPSFEIAVIGRVLETLGLRVGYIAQPDWHDTREFTQLGRPRLFFGVTAGKN